MPKMKTKSAAKKRFKKTATGQIKRAGAYHRHLLTKKSAKRKRHMRSSTLISAVDLPRISRMLPYK